MKEAPTSPSPRALTVSQVAQELGVSERSVWAKIASKELAVKRLSARCVRILREDLERYLSALSA